MAIRRTSSRRTSTSATRRKLVWARQTGSPGTILGANTTVIIPLLTTFQTEYGANLLGATVRRIRGWHGYRAGVAGNSIRVSAGILVAPGTASTSALAPSTNKHLDWMWYADVFAEPVISTEYATLNMLERDVRSQRKVEELGDELLLVLQNTHPTDTVVYTYSSSVLLALP